MSDKYFNNRKIVHTKVFNIFITEQND